MAKDYIDFDSTLYNTEKIRNLLCDLAGALSKYTVMSIEESLESVEKTIKEKRRIFDICSALEDEYHLEESAIRSVVEDIISNGKEIMYPDSIPFLKRIAENGHEVNVLTYKDNEFDYQMKKLMGSGVLSYVDNVIMCSKRKGLLGLDYEKGYFIDDNPKELRSLSEACVSKERLYRMRRDGAIWSGVELDDILVTEITSFEDIQIF